MLNRRQRALLEHDLYFSPVGAARSGVVASGGGDAIPDSGDLHARYDATELSLNDGDSVSTWGDETSNGRDLIQSTSSKQPTYKTGQINNNAVVRFDGSDDLLDVDWTDVSEPYTVFGVFKYRTLDDIWMDGKTKYEWGCYQLNSNWRIYQGNSIVSGGSTDINPHIWASLFNSGSSSDILRIDGTQVGSGDSGNSDATGMTLGARGDNDQFASVDVAEVLFYPQDKSGIYSDVESYLSDKWAVTV